MKIILKIINNQHKRRYDIAIIISEISQTRDEILRKKCNGCRQNLRGQNLSMGAHLTRKSKMIVAVHEVNSNS